MSTKLWRKFIPCECNAEGIMIGYFDDVKEVYLSFFRNYWKNGFSLSEKCRYIWQVLSKGEPYLDEVLLNKSSLIEFRNALNEALVLIEEQEKLDKMVE
jgi:hypothetical protein